MQFIRKKAESTEIENPTKEKSGSHIGEYVVETLEDSKGNLWFGILEKGVAKMTATMICIQQ